MNDPFANKLFPSQHDLKFSCKQQRVPFVPLCISLPTRYIYLFIYRILRYKVHWANSHPSEDEWFSRNDLLDDFPEAVRAHEAGRLATLFGTQGSQR